MYLIGVIASWYWDTLTSRGASMRGRVFVMQTLALLCVLIVVTVYSPYVLVTFMAWGAAALYWEPIHHGFSNRKQEESQARYDAFVSAKKTNDLIDRGKK